MDASAVLAGLHRPELEDCDEDTDVIEWVAAFTGSEEFNAELGDFIEAHAPSFAGVDLFAGTGMTGGVRSGSQAGGAMGGVEHKMEWHEVYREFLGISEAKIERFLAAKGFSAVEFQNACAEALAKQAREHRHSRTSFFVQLLLACTEYEEFLLMMCRSANPELECLADLEMSAQNLLETARVAALSADDREALAAEAGAALEWVMKARRGGVGAVSEREVRAREVEMEEVCNPILDGCLEESAVQQEQETFAHK